MFCILYSVSVHMHVYTVYTVLYKVVLLVAGKVLKQFYFIVKVVHS